MKLYAFLSGIKFLKKYNAKFTFITIVGIHLPVLWIMMVIIFSSAAIIDKAAYLLLAGALTLLATVITLFVLNSLTIPLQKTQFLLNEYLSNHALPDLPDNLDDEIGLMMRDINTLIKNEHTSLAQ